MDNLNIASSLDREFLDLRKKIIESDFAHLNGKQLEAVLATEGTLLILAGAGSGKTTVLINRIAHIVKYGQAYGSKEIPFTVNEETVEEMRAYLAAKTSGGKDQADRGRIERLVALDPCQPWRVLAITFTNKAAGELKDRISAMLGDDTGRDVMASTFHSFCARILRRDVEALGYSSGFTIYDTDDSRRLMKNCMKHLNISEKTMGHKTILGEISRAKDSLINPDEFEKQSEFDVRKKQIAACYKMYQKRMKEADAMDFDDLLFKTVELFLKFPDVLAKYQNRYKYIMVDEYQDTNHAQYKFVTLLAKGYYNLCVVGDDDQSIYKFRGATIENILNFEDEYPDSKVIRLEQNYRSTQNILNASNAVISKNSNRKAKTLWTENPAGDMLSLHTLDNEDEEGRFIADVISEGVSGGCNYSDFAVLYRANAQSQSIERALVKSGIPYRIISGHRFFDRLEVKDAMAYIRVIYNPKDEISLRRVINTPKRGIGDTTLDKASEIAIALGLSLYDVLKEAENYPGLSRAAAKINEFINIIESLIEVAENFDNSLHHLYTTMLEETGYLEMWKALGEEGEGRVENLQELASYILNFEQNHFGDETGFNDLGGFLEETALMTDVDNYDATTDTVVLMTMHASKGLEFPNVILPGFEDGVFPGMQTIFNPEDMEEDRRLCYVAFTRAKKKLYITNTESRMLYGSTTRNRPSRFLIDVPSDLVKAHDNPNSIYKYRRDQAADRKRDIFDEDRMGDSQIPLSERQETGRAARFGGVKDEIGGGVSANMNRQRTEKNISLPSWQEGEAVLHKVFGRGVILSTKLMGNDMLLEIKFDVGVKKLMSNFANLKREK